ncbi:hypothetical protein RND81_06G174400 [Saponaria officinalis]|uniref:50S ribosomal protein L35 n=1 Tax=Saponaria officinalis TaxID=3572 RepID=A0AAW1KEA7_SAPOF
MAISSILSLNLPPLKPQTISPTKTSCTAHGISLAHFNKHLQCTLKLSSFNSISASFLQPCLPHKRFSAIDTASSSSSPLKLTVFAAKGYKMKTHKASAKRFRVTGKGKIVRRRAGKQHLLAKKTTKRKLRLSKMVQVNRSDYDNVVGALPYLKVNRNV